MLLALGAALAFGAGPAEIDLDVTPGTRAVVFPQTESDRAEIGLYGDRRAPVVTLIPLVTSANVVSVGGGTFFVRLALGQPGLDATVSTIAAGRIAIVVGPATRRLVEATSPVPIAVLVGRDLPRRMDVPDTSAMHPLDGDADLLLPDPSRWPLPVPEPVLPQGSEADLVEASPPNWSDLDRYRRALPREGASHTVALIRLGLGNLALGWPREAAYYLAAAMKQPDVDRAALDLARARAAFEYRDWDGARAACGQAHVDGAAPTSVAECLAVVSLATAMPPPSETARALLATSPRPLAAVLAAALFEKDRRHGEARPVLELAVRSLDGEARDRALAMLGDTQLAAADLDAARRSFQLAAVGASRGDLHDLAGRRLDLVDLRATHPSLWAATVPRLAEFGAGPGVDRVEARWMLAQIARRYGDFEVETGELTALHDDQPALAAGSEIDERLAVACTQRLSDLSADGRGADLVAAFRSCWRPELDDRIDGTTPLEQARDAMMGLGLDDDALAVERRIAAIESREGRDDLASLEALAHLYDLTGHGQEALDAIAYARRVKPPEASLGRLDVLEGEARRLLGDVPGARAAWLRARARPSGQDEAALRLALLDADAGDCASAVPSLRAAVEAPVVAVGLDADHLRVLLARCLLNGGRADEAGALAGLVLSTTHDVGLAAQARHVAAVAAYEHGRPAPTDLASSEPLWAALLAEEHADAALVPRVRAARLPANTLP